MVDSKKTFCSLLFFFVWNMIDLSNLTKSEIVKFVDSFDTVITDCNGVLWNSEPFPGVKETLYSLKKLDKKIYYVTNNSCLPLYIHQFKDIGIDFKPNDLIHPTISLINYLKEQKFNKKLFCISNYIILELLNEANIEYCTSPDSCEEILSELLVHVIDDLNIGAIYVDMDININYIKILKALNLLKRADVLFLVGAQDIFIHLTSESYLLGPGVFQNILSELSGRSPCVLGKPSEYLKSIVFRKFKITSPEKVLFVGDTIETDMAFGKICGFQNLLISNSSTLKNIELEEENFYYLPSFGDMNKILMHLEL